MTGKADTYTDIHSIVAFGATLMAAAAQYEAAMPGAEASEEDDSPQHFAVMVREGYESATSKIRRLEQPGESDKFCHRFGAGLALFDRTACLDEIHAADLVASTPRVVESARVALDVFIPRFHRTQAEFVSAHVDDDPGMSMLVLALDEPPLVDDLTDFNGLSEKSVVGSMEVFSNKDLIKIDTDGAGFELTARGRLEAACALHKFGSS